MIGDYYEDENLKLIKINCSLKKHEEMRHICNQHGKQNRDFNHKNKRSEQAQEHIRKRY